MAEKEKSTYITLMQTVSAIAVVILHTNGCFWRFSRERYWFTANIIECLFYFSVPVFFMITGATLMDFYKRYGLKEYFRRRMIKALIPYIAWSLIGITYRVWTGAIPISEVNWQYIGKSIIAGNAVNIYWFFPPLFCVYLCIPLLSAVSGEKRKQIFFFYLAAGFIVNSLIPFIRGIVGFTFSYPYSISVVSGYLLYVIGGAVLHETKRLDGKLRGLFYFLGLGGLLAHIVGTYVLSNEQGRIISVYKGYNNVPCILYSFAVFVLLKTVSQRYVKGRIEKVIGLVGKYTFPIYLMHWFVIDSLVRGFHVNTLSIIYRIGAPIVIIPIIITMAWILRKLPLIRRIVP